MERDFMGLNLKDSVIVVKEEAVDNCRDSAFSKASAVQWPSPNKISTLPHFMSFKVAQEEKMGTNAPDPLASSGFMTLSAADLFDPTQKRQSVENQISHDVKVHPVSNQSVPVPIGNRPFFMNHCAGGIKKQQLLGGIPITSPHSILPSVGSMGGATEPWINTNKFTGAPAQLTIFYGGTVNVYDDISPEKAQAIMFLAGSGIISNAGQQRAQVQTNPKHASGDGVHMNQPVNTPPGSGLSSPLSVSSHPVVQAGGGSAGNDDAIAAKTLGIPPALVSKVDSPKIVSSIGPVTATTMLPSAVPQARKASLARFLEKRKERAMNSVPYGRSKISPECASPGFNGISFSSSTSAVGCISVSTGKETVLDV